jgi:hypothetical protein
VHIQNEAALRIQESLANADFELGGDWMRSRGLLARDSFHFDGPTAHGRRLIP